MIYDKVVLIENFSLLKINVSKFLMSFMSSSTLKFLACFIERVSSPQDIILFVKQLNFKNIN